MNKHQFAAIGLSLAFTVGTANAAGPEAAHAAAAGGAVVNMADYGVPSSITTKYFTRERNNLLCDKIEMSYSRNQGANGTETWLTFINNDGPTGGTECFRQIQRLEPRAGGLYLIAQTHGRSGDINEQQEFENPLLIRPNQAFIGQMWSDATRVRFPNEGDDVVRAARINGTVTARISSMTVQERTWNDCISVFKDYAGDSFLAFGHGYAQTQYYCRGIGEVKRIRIFKGGPGDPSISEVRELEDYQ